MSKPLSDSDHVLRYCSPIHVDIAKAIIKASAFRFRPSEESLSVNWMEYFGKPVKQQVDGIRTALSKKLKPKGRFAKLRVGTVKKRIQGAEVKHLHEAEDPSHAGIYIDRQNNRGTALELANMIKPDDIFPALEDH